MRLCDPRAEALKCTALQQRRSEQTGRIVIKMEALKKYS